MSYHSQVVRVATVGSDVDIDTVAIKIHGVTVMPDGTNLATVIISNGASATATNHRWEGRTPGTQSLDVNFPAPFIVNDPVIKITGTGAIVYVRTEPV